jgi:hypothetical protein
MDGDIGGAVEEAALQLFQEQSLAAGGRQRPVLDPIPRGGHLHQLGLEAVMMPFQLLCHPPGLPQCERAPARGYPERGHVGYGVFFIPPAVP